MPSWFWRACTRPLRVEPGEAGLGFQKLQDEFILGPRKACADCGVGTGVGLGCSVMQRSQL